MLKEPWQRMRAACLCVGLWVVGHVKVALALGSMLTAVIYHRMRSRAKTVDVPEIENRAAEVHSQIQKIQIDQGAAMAHAVVMRTYADELKALNKNEALAAESLLHQPDELARYLVRVSGTQRRPEP